MAVVDLLEQIDVGDDRGEWPPAVAGTLECRLAELAHLLVVEQAGQAVVLGLPAVAAAIAEQAAQQDGKQDGDDQQSGHARGQQQLPALVRGDLYRSQRLLGFEQGDLLFLQPGVELHLQVGQPALAGDALGPFRGGQRLFRMGQRRGDVAAFLGQPGEQALGLGDGKVRLLFPVIPQGVGEQRPGLVELPIRCDQAPGDDEPGAVRAAREACDLEFRERFAGPPQCLGVVPLAGRHLADAILAIGGENRVVGAGTGLDLAMPPALRLAKVVRMVLGQRHVAQGQAQRPRVVSGRLDLAQALQRQLPGFPGLADKRMQVAGDTEQLGRFRGGLGQVRQALVEPGERQWPVLDIGGEIDRRGVHADAKRRRHLLFQQLGHALQRGAFVAGEPEIAQADELDALALLRRERIHPRRQGVDLRVRFAPGCGDGEPLDLLDLRLQRVGGKRRRAGEGQREQRDQDQPVHVLASNGKQRRPTDRKL